jgi:hypothetical protein
VQANASQYCPVTKLSQDEQMPCMQVVDLHSESAVQTVLSQYYPDTASLQAVHILAIQDVERH